MSLIEQLGGEPITIWVPDQVEEPAFLAYSITKTFTASLVLKLCEKGQLALEDKLSKWFPSLEKLSKISVRRLLNHTSGVPDYGSLAAYHEAVRLSPSMPWSSARFVAETIDKGLLFDEGSSWAYSNVGYMLLKQILENVSGLPYRVLVTELIVTPLRLRRTYVAESVADLALLAPSSSAMLSPDGSLRDVRTHYHPGWVSHGVIASTSSDIALFLDGLFAGRLLSMQFVERMLEAVPLPPLHEQPTSHNSPLRPHRPAYGMGLMIDRESPWGFLVGHNGGGPGYGASAFHAIDLNGLSVCAMGSMEEGFDPESLVARVLDDFGNRV